MYGGCVVIDWHIAFWKCLGVVMAKHFLLRCDDHVEEEIANFSVLGLQCAAGAKTCLRYGGRVFVSNPQILGKWC